MASFTWHNVSSMWYCVVILQSCFWLNNFSHMDIPHFVDPFVTEGSRGCPREDSAWSSGDWALVFVQEKFKSETDAGKWMWFIKNESTHLKGKWGWTQGRVTLKSQSGIYPSRGENWWCPIDVFLHLLPMDRTLCFLHFLPYLVSPERSWHQMHDGSWSNLDANEIIMIL